LSIAAGYIMMFVLVCPDGHSCEAQRDISTQIAQQVLDALRGVDYRNVLNLPFIAGPEYSKARPYLELVEKVSLPMDVCGMDVLPEGHVLVMRSRDVPGVIGAVGSRLADHNVNIAEWRLGRDRPGGMALSFVNLDQPVPEAGLRELRALPQVFEARPLQLMKVEG